MRTEDLPALVYLSITSLYLGSFMSEDFASEECSYRMRVHNFVANKEVCRKAMAKAGVLPTDPAEQERAIRYEVERAGAVYYSPEVIKAVEDEEEQEKTALHRYLVESGMIARDPALADEQLQGMIASATEAGREGVQRLRSYRLKAKEKYLPDYNGSLEKWDPVLSLA